MNTTDEHMAQIQQKLETLEAKIDAQTVIVNRLYKVFLATVIVSVIAFVLPLIGLVFALPSFLSTYSAALNM